MSAYEFILNCFLLPEILSQVFSSCIKILCCFIIYSFSSSCLALYRKFIYIKKYQQFLFIFFQLDKIKVKLVNPIF